MLSLWLGGCGWNARPAADDGAWVAQRQQAFANYGVWRVHGRMAMSDGDRGGSAGFVLNDSSTGGLRLNISSSAGRWRLVSDSGGAELTGHRIGTRRAPEPEPLVADALGWYVPVMLMRDWLRGIPAPAGARHEYDENGTLKAVYHDSWHIEYQRFREEQGLWLPQKVVARSGDYRVSLVILGWRLGGQERSAARGG